MLNASESGRRVRLCRVTTSRASGFFVVVVWLAIAPVLASADCVVLLHGLARTSNSMKPLQKSLEADGHQVINVGYPSREKSVEELAPVAVEQTGFKNCNADSTVHFVTHSMGGILVRYYLEKKPLPSLGRVVMLAPPNQGSQVVDRLRNVPGFKLLNGVAGLQLGTDDKSIPNQLGPVDFELGIIAGTRTFNPGLSQFLPNPDDGKVSVDNTKVEGMSDFLQLPVTHTFIMRSEKVIKQVKHFIDHGSFSKE